MLFSSYFVLKEGSMRSVQELWVHLLKYVIDMYVHMSIGIKKHKLSKLLV